MGVSEVRRAMKSRAPSWKTPKGQGEDLLIVDDWNCF